MHLGMVYMKEFINFTHVFWWSLYLTDTEALILDRQRCQEAILADLGIRSGASLKGHNTAGENQSFCLFLNADGRRIKVWPQLGSIQTPILFA